MSYDPTALATLLRSTGKTAIQIATLMRANRPAHINKDASSQKVDAWIRGKSLPRDEVRGWLADALNIPRAGLYRACAGEGPGWPDILPDHTIVRAGTIGCGCRSLMARLIALTADETPVELCYHPDGDDGSGNGWLLIVGDRTVAVGTLDKVLNAS